MVDFQCSVSPEYVLYILTLMGNTSGSSHVSIKSFFS